MVVTFSESVTIVTGEDDFCLDVDKGEAVTWTGGTGVTQHAITSGADAGDLFAFSSSSTSVSPTMSTVAVVATA